MLKHLSKAAAAIALQTLTVKAAGYAIRKQFVGAIVDW